MKKIKVVATIGPATSSKEMISKLVDAGVDTIRLNLSHGDHKFLQNVINIIKDVRKEKNTATGILLDTKGPEIRTGKFSKGEVKLEEGNKYVLYTTEHDGDQSGCSVSHRKIIDDVKVGDTILIDDGLVSLTIKELKKDSIVTVINNSGVIDSYKGINLPDSKVSLPALSEKDKNDLVFGCKNKVDFVAASFIQTADDVKGIRQFLNDNDGKDIWIISKIESQEGINNFDSILEESNGIMVARGDLGVETPIEELPFRQKEMISKSNKAFKFVITATQMLESMVNNPRPTRAEVSDVANAVLDGTDAVMLSGETAKGKYPIEAVQVMDKVAMQADGHVDPTAKDKTISSDYISDAEIKGVKAIVAITINGRSTMKMRSKFPSMPIVALTLNEHRFYQLNIVRGIKPVLVNESDISIKNIKATASKHLIDLGYASKGDKIALISSKNPLETNPNNDYEIITI